MLPAQTRLGKDEITKLEKAKVTDILVVPPDLREAALDSVKPGTPILVTPPSAAAGAFAELVTRLEAGADFTAEKIDPATP